MIRKVAGPLIALGSLGLCLLVFEIALRVAGFNPFGELLNGRELILRESSHPRLPYELVPGTDAYAWGAHVSVNSAGFRDDEYPESKGDRYRVVVIGDSITFGNDLREDQRFTEMLEADLAERYPDIPVDVLNLGVGGFDTVMEVAFLEQIGLRYDPDLVVVAFCVNDVSDNSPNARYIRSLRAVQSPAYRLRTLQLVRVALDRVLLRLEHAARNSDLEAQASNLEYVDSPINNELLDELESFARSQIGPDESQPLVWYRSRARLSKVAFAFNWLGSLAKENGFEVLVSIVPYLDSNPGFLPVYEVVEKLAEEEHFSVLRVEDRFIENDPAKLRIRAEDGIHPNVEGHRLIAESLAPEVIASAQRSRE